MRQGQRFGLSAVQKSELWCRWKAGQSLHEIGRALGKEHSSIRCLVARHGGIVPAVRRRSRRVLTAIEREDISRGLASGASFRKIAQLLERATSTVSREVARHGGRPEYRAHEADQRAWDSALRPKRCLLAIHVKLRKMVASKLILDWSPEQISGWLKIQYPDDESMRVSHETIYRSLFIQARGVLKKELLEHLRSKRRIRHSRFTALVKVSGKDTAVVVAALTRHVRKLPAALPRSLTWDRGLEMAKHKSFTEATDVKVYFCDPQSPWQRGSNENTNGVLRQHFPKKTHLSDYTQSDLDKVALRLNQRPRKTLGFQTPASKLRVSVASTH